MSFIHYPLSFFLLTYIHLTYLPPYQLKTWDKVGERFNNRVDLSVLGLFLNNFNVEEFVSK